MIFSFILWCLPIAMKVYAWRSPKLRALIAEKDFVAQIMIKDGSRGRWFRFVGGRIESGSGVIENPDVLLRFKSPALGIRVIVHLSASMFHFAFPILKLFLEPMEVINAAKNFAMEVRGKDEFIVQFYSILNTC